MIQGLFRAVLVLLSVVIATSLSAQESSVEGVVKDQYGPLIGASVIVENTTTGAVTDIDGKFEIKGLNPGPINLQISFIGYETITHSLVLKSGVNKVSKPIQMKPGLALKQVTVEGKMSEGNEKAMSMQRKSVNLSQVVASENIESLPDRNAAEALQRLPGVVMETDQGEGSYISFRGTPTDWGAALINGDRLPVADEEDIGRAFNFDILPTSLIEYIQFNLTLSPEIEGDAIGGSANFISKQIPDSFNLEVQAGAGYNNKALKPLYELSLAAGTRLGKNKKLGIVGGGSVYNRNWATDNYEFFYSNNDNHNIERLELRKYDGERTSYGAHLKLQYDFNKNNSIYALGFYGRLEDMEFNRKTMYNWVAGVGQSIIVQNIHNLMINDILGGTLGGEHKVTEKLSVDWRVSQYETEFKYGPSGPDNGLSADGYNVIEYEKLVKFTDYLYLDEAGNPTDEQNAYTRLRLLDIDSPVEGYGTPADNIQPTWDNVVPIKPEDTLFLHKKTYAELRNVYEKDPIVIALNLNYEINSRNKIRFGGKYRDKEGYRTYGLESWVRDANNSNTALVYNDQELRDIPNLNTYQQAEGGHYQPYTEQFLSDEDMQNWLVNNKDQLKFLPFGPKTTDLYKQFVGSNYEYNENVIAFYAAYNKKIGSKLTLDLGLRYEQTDVYVKAPNAVDSTYFNFETGEAIVDTWLEYDEMSRKYDAFLPMLNFVFDINEKSLVKGAVTRSFRRPNFSEVKPGQPDIHYTHFHALYGNPDLNPTYSTNVDLSYQRYTGLQGVITITGFYKYVTDHIYTAFKSTDEVNISGVANTFRPPGGILAKEYKNAPYANLFGFELSFQQPLKFMPGILKNLVFSGNYAFTESKMKIESREELQPLPRQAKHLANVRLGYEGEKFQATIASTFRSSYLMELNLIAVEDPETGEPVIFNESNDFDQYMGKTLGLDASISYNINKHFSVYAEGNNLLNTPFIVYRGRIERPIQVEYYSFRVLGGVKYKF